MNINELEREKTRLTKQLSDILREKEEIQSSLTHVLNELEAHNSGDPEQQVWNKSKEIDYDTKDYTLEQIINAHKEHKIECFPTAMWDTYKQSKFIESFLLGLSISTLYMADTKCGYLKTIDGNQRVLTLVAFINNQLELNGLKVLDTFNGLYFKDLIPSRQRKIMNTSIRVVIFSNTNEELRKDLANRFNGNYELDSSQLSLSEFLQTKDGQMIYKAGYEAMELCFNGGYPYPDTSYPSGSLEYEAFHYGVRDAYTTLGHLSKTQE